MLATVVSINVWMSLEVVLPILLLLRSAVNPGFVDLKMATFARSESVGLIQESEIEVLPGVTVKAVGKEGAFVSKIIEEEITADSLSY